MPVTISPVYHSLIECETCSTFNDDVSPSSSKKEVVDDTRKLMKEKGWKKIGGKLMCPKCSTGSKTKLL